MSTKQSKNDLEEKKALTVRMDQLLFDKIEEVAEELGQKSAAVARNYLKLSPFVFIKSTMEITARDNNPLMLLPSSVFELITQSLRAIDEKTQAEIGDKMASILNVNMDILGYTTNRQKFEFIKTLGWFKYGPGDFLKIPRRFGPPMMVISMIYRIMRNRKLPGDWTREFFQIERMDLASSAAKKIDENRRRQIDTGNRVKDEYLKSFGDYDQVLFQQLQDYDFYEFRNIKLEPLTPATGTPPATTPPT
jgi:hypothetical protein